MLRPLMGESPHYVHNTMDLIQNIKNIKLQQEECISSYEVPSVPMEPAIKTIKKF